jgi:hypothetical protein
MQGNLHVFLFSVQVGLNMLHRGGGVDMIKGKRMFRTVFRNECIEQLQDGMRLLMDEEERK